VEQDFKSPAFRRAFDGALSRIEQMVERAFAKPRRVPLKKSAKAEAAPKPRRVLIAS
jgi:hypothetical protein